MKSGPGSGTSKKSTCEDMVRICESIPSDQYWQINTSYLAEEEKKKHKCLCSHYWRVESAMRLWGPGVDSVDFHLK